MDEKLEIAKIGAKIAKLQREDKQSKLNEFRTKLGKEIPKEEIQE